MLIPAIITRQPASQKVGLGSNAVFTVAAVSTMPPIRYQWRFNDADIPGATAATLTITNAQPEHDGDYQVVLTDGIASIQSDPARLIVLVNPVIVTHPESQILAVGQECNLTVEVTNTATVPVFYRLRRNNQVFSDALLEQRAATFTFTNVSLSNSASYFYTITNLARSASTLSYTAFVAVVLPPTNLTVEAGAEAAFTVVVGNPSSLARPAQTTCEWQWNGVALTNEPRLTKATNAGVALLTNTLVLPAVRPEQAGAYAVVVNVLTNVPIAPARFAATLHVGGAEADRDGDGLPDAWELAHHFNPDLDDALADADRDGMNNRAEYLAGTDPQDGQSFLKVALEWSLAGSQVAVRFGAVSNKTYSVLYQERLSAPLPWSKLADVPAAPTNRTVRVPDPSPGAPARFYRLTTPSQP